MNDTLVAITVLWIFVFIYSIAASIDFGAGFWSFVYLNQEKTKATNIANRYLSPSWEITNVFIVLIVVGLVTFFPGATYSLAAVLLIPVSIILLLLAIRSAFLVFSHSAKGWRTPLTVVTGLTGLIIPGLLILVLPITHGGYIVRNSAGVEVLDFATVFTSLNIYLFMAFAISSTLYLSSLLLADYSHVADAPEAYRVYRRDAMLIGPVTMVFALFTAGGIKQEANWLYIGLVQNRYWLIASVIAFAIGYAAMFMPGRRGWPGWPRVAVIGSIVQYLLAAAAYGEAHLPYLVYPTMTLEAGATNEPMLHALFWCYLVGFAILLPGFIIFWRMFMTDRRYVKGVPRRKQKT